MFPRTASQIVLCSLVATSAALTVKQSFAGSATWLPAPPNNRWNEASNWTAGGPPNGISDSATFGTSNRVAISVASSTFVDSINFTSGASAFTITVKPDIFLFISSAVENNSGLIQTVVANTG